MVLYDLVDIWRETVDEHRADEVTVSGAKAEVPAAGAQLGRRLVSRRGRTN